VHMIYVWLNSADLAASRVADRVKQGGHDVHPDVIRRRYWRSAANLFDLYLPLANTWTLCDNSGRELVTVACGGEGQAITVFDPQAYELIRQAAAHGRT
jgi:predicted ABC-type ATPase